MNGNQIGPRLAPEIALLGGDPVEVARLSLPPSTPEGFTFTADGKTLYGTSYYTGASNVFRFDIATREI